jgi:hypothetical protein
MKFNSKFIGFLKTVRPKISALQAYNLGPKPH